MKTALLSEKCTYLNCILIFFFTVKSLDTICDFFLQKKFGNYVKKPERVGIFLIEDKQNDIYQTYFSFYLYDFVGQIEIPMYPL